jgi:hypothetical protein
MVTSMGETPPTTPTEKGTPMSTLEFCTWKHVTGSDTVTDTVIKRFAENDTCASAVELRAIAAAYEAACDFALMRQCPVPEFADFVGLVGNVVYADPYENDTTVDTVKSVIRGVPLDKIIKGVLAVTRPSVADCLKEQPAN